MIPHLINWRDRKNEYVMNKKANFLIHNLPMIFLSPMKIIKMQTYTCKFCLITKLKQPFVSSNSGLDREISIGFGKARNEIIAQLSDPKRKMAGSDKMFLRKKSFTCLVCGYDRLPGPLYSKEGVPDVSLICLCCAFQPGYDDDELGNTFESYRREWIENGAEWFDEKKKPVKWDVLGQLKNIENS